MSDSVNINLWPGTPPGGDGVKPENRIQDLSGMTKHVPEPVVFAIGTPYLIPCIAPRPNGAAVVIIPGGGYGQIWYGKEGLDIAARLAEAGMTSFVLQYRLPCGGWAQRQDVPMQDAMRAMRLIRRDAAKFGIDPAKLGAMGFSAGGHLTATLATRSDAKVYDAVDEADALSARPAFACLMYPVVTMGAGTHQGSRDNLLGPDLSPEKIAAYSCEKLVTGQTPPTFIAHAVDDELVPFGANSMAMYKALQAAKVPSELHAFQSGGHGFALRDMAGKPFAAWPDLFLAWAKSHNFIT
jgi:acetyl esterase/lipase